MAADGDHRLSAAVWDLSTPTAGHTLPGVQMAGFSGCAPRDVELRMVPGPAVTVFLDLGDGAIVAPDGRRIVGGGVVAAAADDVRTIGRDVDCVQVRLSPLLAHRVAPELAGVQVATLDEVWGSAAQRLADRLAHTPSWDRRFALVADTLTARSGPPADPEVAFAWRTMLRSRGLVSVDALAREVGWSRKRMWSRFGAQIGLAPKRAAQLIRFDGAAHGLATGTPAADVAAAYGFTDQSHLNRETRSFAGLTPGALAGEPWLAVDDRLWRRRA